MSDGVTYHELIARNRRNSVLLVAAFILFAGGVVGILGGAVLDARLPEALALAGIATLGAGLASCWSYYRGGATILRMSDAHRIEHADDPELYNVVEEMAIAAGVPPPPVYLIDDTAMNAFATGRDAEHAAVAITRGLRDKLSRDELQAVLAHEMSHVRNLDIRLMMLLATLVGLVVLVADSFWRSLRLRMWSGASRRRGGSRGGGGGAILLVVAIVLSAVAPVLARVIQLAASRQREYLADAGAVELTRNPEAMISALRRLGEDREVLEVANRATAHLYIVQPIKRWEKRARGLFATHPPLEDRIQRLEGLLGGGSGSRGEGEADGQR